MQQYREKLKQFLNKILTFPPSVSIRMIRWPCYCHTFQVLYKDEITFNERLMQTNKKKTTVRQKQTHAPTI